MPIASRVVCRFVSTRGDVDSEGQNLQDSGPLVTYDLHWNPMRMVQ